MSDDEPHLTDVRAIRAVSHPARIAILEYLGGVESATATECAEIVGLSPSATSYHLRELAKYELVTEAPGTDKRERRWRSRGSFRVDGGRDDPARQDAVRLFGQLVMSRGDRQVKAYMDHAADEPEEWWDAARFTEAGFEATADELRALNEAVDKLVEPYRQRKGPIEGSRRVRVTYRAFPRVDDDGHTEEPPG